MTRSGPAQVELVGDDRLAARGELGCQRQVEGVAGEDVLRRDDQVRVAEGEPGRAQRPDVVQVGQVELQLPVELADHRVQRTRRARGSTRSARRTRRRNSRATSSAICAPTWVMPGQVRYVHPVVLDRALLEPLERLLDLGAVVRLAVVAADFHPRALDPDLVGDGGQVALAVGGVGGEPGEACRGQRSRPGSHGTRSGRARSIGRAPRSLASERDRVAVDRRRVQEPALALAGGVHLRPAAPGEPAPGASARRTGRPPGTGCDLPGPGRPRAGTGSCRRRGPAGRGRAVIRSRSSRSPATASTI